MKRWMMVVVVLGVGACAFDSDPIEPVDTPAIADDGLEYIVVEPTHDLGLDNEVLQPGDRLVPDPQDDPCQCSTNQCLEDWADKNFGCNLCVTIVCGSGPTHVCTICDSTESGENGFNDNQP